MNIQLFVLLMSLLASCGTSFAGTVTSGGGRLFRYAQNPWWVENTKEVSYCIEIDSVNFDDLEVDEAKTMIEASLSSWKNVYDKLEDGGYEDGQLVPYGQLRLATQKFVYEPCSGQTDLRFQFGVISKDQKKNFVNIKDFVGAAVRTEYDLVNLSSKGFIYIAPLKGDNAPSTDDLEPAAWTLWNRSFLKISLDHEVGHIFGNQDNTSEDLMDGRTLEALISKKMIAGLKLAKISGKSVRRITTPEALAIPMRNVQYKGCGDSGRLNPIWNTVYFGIPNNVACSKITVNPESYKIVIETAENASTPYSYYGEIKWNQTSGTGSFMARLDLPSQQKVFSKIPDSYGSLLGEYADKETTFSGTFKSASGMKKPVLVQFKSGNQVSVTGFEKNKFVEDLWTIQLEHF
jgi:hypothetical protein